jgi:prepilin-type N-terminal cleavage/methylation domain-containing protein
MIDRQMKNEKGFTLIEMLIAMAISVVVLGAAISTYSKQDKVLRDETRNLQTRDYARLAMDRLMDDLILIGYGFPPGNSSATACPSDTGATAQWARGITNADATTMTYKANIGSVSTYANLDVTSMTNGFFVTDTTGFAVNDNVVFYNVENPCDWNEYPANGVTTTSPFIIAWQSSNKNDYDFNPIGDNVAVVLNRYHTITYTYDSGNQWIRVTDDQGTDDGGTDDTTVTVASKVSGFTFNYFDANGNALTTLPLSADDLGSVRKIRISITAVSDGDTDITATLLTEINLRNMGI